nr:hypothetical protein StreXyl84_77410 [Streptomyces sp. Xyl84]
MKHRSLRSREGVQQTPPREISQEVLADRSKWTAGVEVMLQGLHNGDRLVVRQGDVGRRTDRGEQIGTLVRAQQAWPRDELKVPFDGWAMLVGRCGRRGGIGPRTGAAGAVVPVGPG